MSNSRSLYFGPLFSCTLGIYHKAYEQLPVDVLFCNNCNHLLTPKYDLWIPNQIRDVPFDLKEVWEAMKEEVIKVDLGNLDCWAWNDWLSNEYAGELDILRKNYKEVIIKTCLISYIL